MSSQDNALNQAPVREQRETFRLGGQTNTAQQANSHIPRSNQNSQTPPNEPRLTRISNYRYNAQPNPESVIQSQVNSSQSLVSHTNFIQRQISVLSANTNSSADDPLSLIRRNRSMQSSRESMLSSQYSNSEDIQLPDSNNSSSSIASEEARAIAERQAQLRKSIVQIQSDSTLSATEKAKKIQELMSSKWIQKQQEERTAISKPLNKISDKKEDFSKITEEDKKPTYFAEGVLGCRHYQRACKLQAHCCGKWDTCRFCHDEVSDHTITRNLITTMMCMYCSTVQPAGQICTNAECGKKVSNYYCKECKLWDNDPRKNIYHCYDCGICRIGKGLGIDYFHCPTCNVCMAIGLLGRHKCIERNLESDCPICGEYMFTSTSTVIFMPCGHCMHHKCHQQYIQTSFQCPTCLKALADMSEYYQRIDAALIQHKMPPEYDGTFSSIYCNDCEKKSWAKFHFLYHKCAHCLGYNTKSLGNSSTLPPDALMAPPVTVSSLQLGGEEASSESLEMTEDSSEGDESESSSSSVHSYWCHQCQVPSHVREDPATGQMRCEACYSDFVEHL